MCVQIVLKKEGGEFTKVKPKRKNLEKRREKSKHAARERRSNETEIYSQLAHELPFQHKICSALDKSSVMRLAIGYLKAKNLFSPKDERSLRVSKEYADDVYLKAFDGFLMILTDDGMMVYLSETVTKYLGIKQIDMIGQSIYEYAHPCDHAEIREEIEDKSSYSTTEEMPEKNHQFSIRLKSTITPSGKIVNLKSAGFKVIQLSGHSKLIQSEVDSDGFRAEPVRYFILIGQPIAHPSNLEVPLDSKSFLTQHNLDMTYTYCDDRVTELLGYQPEELNGKCVYDFYHGFDLADLKETYQKMYACGQAATGQYRFLAKEGGYAWLKTEATIITNKKPVSVVCVNYVISQIEDKGQILSADQKGAWETLHGSTEYSADNTALGDSQDGLEWTAVGNTELVFADGDCGQDRGCSAQQDDDLANKWNTPTFLNQDDTLDLDYLAPTAGDALIPLDMPAIEELCSDEQDFALFADLWGITPDGNTSNSPFEEQLQQMPAEKIKNEEIPHIIKSDDFANASCELTRTNGDGQSLPTNGLNKEPTTTPFNKPHSAFTDTNLDLPTELKCEPSPPPLIEPADQSPGHVQLLGKRGCSPSSPSQWQLCEEPPEKRPCLPQQDSTATITQEGNSELIRKLLGDFCVINESQPNAQFEKGGMILPLADLTEQDTEVNAPVKFRDLLQGTELVEVLEQSAF